MESDAAGARQATLLVPDGSAVLDAYICVTCGVQYAPTEGPPTVCPICCDDRQFIGWDGQQWTTMSRLQAAGHRNTLQAVEPHLDAVATVPATAIGQRAFLLHTDEGNVLWDCVTLFDDDTAHQIELRGGLEAIAISHPHFCASMSAWAQAFDAPVYVHALDRDWVQYPGPWIQYWEGESQALLPGVTLIHVGGHFPGSAVLHWAHGAQGRGVLLAADTVKPAMDRRYVSFMYSIVNLIPLPAREVRRIGELLSHYRFDRIYSLWAGHEVHRDGNAAVARSVERYLQHLES